MRHGICLPLFSLRTKEGNSFLSLIPLIDWCKSLKLDCIQLLPINDTGDDSSPYNPLSSCALNPIYLRINGSYGLKALREVFEKTFDELLKTSNYQIFVKENQWLSGYSLFKTLKEQFGGIHWKDWPVGYAKPEQRKVDFYTFLQFHCFSQMKQVREHATKQGIDLKGDLPILPSPDSADVWENPHLFRLDLDAGTPPDLYNPLGQHWGFPLFNWEAMRRSGFAWWKQRLKIFERCFHICRIDHIVGFFRIWAIPKGNKPADGFFIPTDPAQWLLQGEELLKMMLSATSMIPIAEDLGTIPKEVPSILKRLGIYSTKVVRWQRHWETDRSYIPFNEYEPLSMTTLSTPDMDPLELWWRKYPAESVPFAAFMGWSYHPILTNKERLAILRAAHHTSSFFHINPLQEYLALFPELVWPNPEEERINFPGTQLPTNWAYRFRPSLEEIVNHDGLREAFRVILDT